MSKRIAIICTKHVWVLIYHNSVKKNKYTMTSIQNIIEYLQFGPRAGDATIEEPIATSQSLTLSTPLVFYGNPLSTINVRILL